MKEKSEEKLSGEFGTNEEDASLDFGSNGMPRTPRLLSKRGLKRKVSKYGNLVVIIILFICISFIIGSCITLYNAVKVLIANDENQKDTIRTLTVTLDSIVKAQSQLSLTQEQIKSEQEELKEGLKEELKESQGQILSSAKALEQNYQTQMAGQQQISMSLHAALQNIQIGTQSPTQGQTSNTKSSEDCPEVDFYKLGLKYGTDKVTTHRYDNTYAKYFAPIRCKPLKMLEIGLGCDMNYGPGASYYLWLEYFPNAEIYFIEYDKACADAWTDVNPRVKVYAGDQANVTFLHEFLDKTGGQFDFIIDDGGHTMNQQIVSLEELFSSVKIGGTYFLEDLLTSFWPKYGGGDTVQNTTLNYIKDIISDLMARRGRMLDYTKRDISKLVFGVDCMDEVCAFARQEPFKLDN